MRLVTLIVLASACGSKPAAPSQPTLAAAAATETVWDQGTFVVFSGGKELPGHEETFEIKKTADGFRLDVDWQRPEGQTARIQLTTDHKFSPLTGEMTSVQDGKTTRSTIIRDPSGLLATEVFLPNGERTTGEAKERSDWYVGGSFTSLLAPLCHADDTVTNPIVYPGKATTLTPAKPLTVEGVDRRVTIRVLEYAESKRTITVACEDGKLIAERATSGVIIRRGDHAVARAL